MSNYREKTAKVVGAGSALFAAADDFVRGNIFEGLFEGAIFGGLGYFTVHALGYLADWISGGNEKKAQSNDAIYKKLTA